MKETKYLFDVPVKKDWLFYVFLVVLVSNIIGGLTNVVASGGLSLSSGGILSGTIDAVFKILLSWFPLIPIIYIIRKQVRKKKSIQDN